MHRMRTVHDRLGMLQQGAKGWPEESLLHSLVERAEKGLWRHPGIAALQPAPGTLNRRGYVDDGRIQFLPHSPVAKG